MRFVSLRGIHRRFCSPRMIGKKSQYFNPSRYRLGLCLKEYLYILEVIVDYRFPFVTYGNEMESKESSFLWRDAPDKINRGGQSAVACDSSKISAFMPQEHQIRIRSDKCENTNAITLVFECGLLYGSNKAWATPRLMPCFQISEHSRLFHVGLPPTQGGLWSQLIRLSIMRRRPSNQN